MEIPLVLLCAGPENWLKTQAVERLKAECLKPEFEEMDFARFDASQMREQAILEAAQTPPFGSAFRLVVVDGIEESDAGWTNWLSAYLKNPNPKCCLILCAMEVGKEMRGFLQTRREGVQFLSCFSPKGADLKEWIAQQARLVGKSVEPAAAHLLVQRCGEQLQPLALAIESLALLTGPHPKITPADVEALIGRSVRETVFDILDHAAAGQTGQAAEELHQALFQGSLTVEQMVGALGWYYRMVWKTRTAGMKSGWLSPKRQAALNRLSRWPDSKLRKALEEVFQADVHLKTGYPSPELLADQLLLRLGN